jgi:hypothetical protein
MSALRFKVASEADEFEKIHRLNYRTFVDEIPQHEKNPEERLVDKFHEENTYFICLNGEKLAGMVCVRANRPFSLDRKLDNLDSFLPPHKKACEVRLLAVDKKYRGPRVLQGLLSMLVEYCIKKEYDLALISGTTRQAKLYRHIGFKPFGPLVGRGDTLFQPMYFTFETFRHGRFRKLVDPSR